MKAVTAPQAARIRTWLTQKNKRRDLALFNTALDTMLRASDLLPLRVSHITDHKGRIVSAFPIRQRKTRAPHVVALSPDTRRSILEWVTAAKKGPNAFLWTSIGNRKTRPYLTREQYANLVKHWVAQAGLDFRKFSTHSMRRSKPTAIYDATKDLEACRQLLGQKNIASTAHYLSVTRRRALNLAKKFKL